jgi:hypothetical protein
MTEDKYAAKLQRLAAGEWPIIIALQTHVAGQLLLGEVHEEDVTADGFIALNAPAIVTEAEDRMIVTKLTGIRGLYFLNPRQYVGFGLADSPYLENYLEWKRHAR